MERFTTVKRFECEHTMEKFSHLDIIHPRDEIVDTMQRMYDRQLTTMSGGNVSIKDSDGTIWITPGSTDKGEMKRDEVMYREKGSDEWIGKSGLKPSREWPFHTRILDERPDAKAVLHAHSQSLVAFSCTNRVPETLSLYHAYHICGKAAMSEYRMPGAPELADAIAEKIRDHDCVIMESHGVVICAESLTVCFGKFELLEFCAEAIVRASALGGNRILLSVEDYLLHNEIWRAELGKCVHGMSVRRPEITSKEAHLRHELVKFSKRAYETGLIVASIGAFSARLSKTSFLITPMGVDRRFMQPNDILLFDMSDEETTKIYAEKPTLTPSIRWKMLADLYEAFPDVESMTFATPRYFSAFTMTDINFPNHIHPETYIVVQGVGRIGFLESLDYGNVAEVFAKGVHAVAIDNQGVAILGKSVQDAFDKLEILESTTKVVLDCISLGGYKSMSEKEVDEIDRHYFGKGSKSKSRVEIDGCGHAALMPETGDEEASSTCRNQ